MRRWLVAALLSCSIVAAQTKATSVFDKAPPEIDDALRARVSKYLQAHVDAKYRQAEELVAEDSKDFYYNMEKPRYFSFEIIRINYSENFTKAAVVASVEVDWRSPRLGSIRVKPPMTSLWKFESGQWYWHVVPQKEWDTPWGKMTPGPDAEKKVAAMFKGVDPRDVVRQVSVSTTEIRLKGYEPSEGRAVISNGMPGSIRLRLNAPEIAGLEVKIDKTELNRGEQATVSVRYNPPTREPKRPSEFSLGVEPIAQTYRIALVFDVQPELLEQLPKELQKR